MPYITIFQCLPAYKALPTNRLIAALQKLNCRILLDLEDSIKDVLIPGKSKQLKQEARVELAKLFNLNPGFKFDVRINSPQSGEYEKDIELVNDFRQHIKSIFIPKTESVDDIFRVLKDTGNTVKVNPIFETVNGIKNKEQVCVPQVDNLVEFFFYGNYDFHLDANIFPINEQNTEAYWKIATSLIKTIEKGFCFGNSPYSNISDSATLRYSLFQLNRLCTKNFAVMSLHKNQTLEYMKLQPCNIINIAATPGLHIQVINSYVSGKLKGRGFAIDKSAGRIITPQEYLLALNNKES